MNSFNPKISALDFSLKAPITFIGLSSSVAFKHAKLRLSRLGIAGYHLGMREAISILCIVPPSFDFVLAPDGFGSGEDFGFEEGRRRHVFWLPVLVV